VNYFVCLVLVAEASHEAVLALISVSAVISVL
jgi:hypothetical protein